MQHLIRHKPEKEDIPDIEDIIANRKLTVCFQPVVSVSRKTVSGIEGLIRGKDTAEGSKLISPLELFHAAHKADLTLELDRVCRDKVLEAYSRVCSKDPSKLLFLNVDASILERGAGSNYLYNQVLSYEINPGSVVIEINESKVQNDSALRRFVEKYRGYGFMIALDDVGTGFSNMDRILIVKPDIIKVDMTLIRDIHADHYKQGVFKSLVNLSNKIGTLIVAEGVETKEEATQILRLGGHLIQGYFFSKPQEAYSGYDIFLEKSIDILRECFTAYMKEKILDEKLKNKQLNIIVSKSIKALAKVPHEEFESELFRILRENRNIECVYILDENGVQLSDTIRLPDKSPVKKNMFFCAARKGTDLSMEKYYYPLISARLKKYITEPYISLATGNLCITCSRIFTNADDKKFILCMDFMVNENNYPFDLVKDAANPDMFNNLKGNSPAEISRILSQMNEKIFKDSLTGLYNRRYIEERLPIDICRASMENMPISVIVADLDHFKKVNDDYGHLAGDLVIKEFARIAESTVRRGSDWIARYGGEEFLIVLVNAGEEAAFMVSEEIRQAVGNANLGYNKTSISITASFGTFTHSCGKISYEQMIDLADKNLYVAKNTGRNKTVSNIGSAPKLKAGILKK